MRFGENVLKTKHQKAPILSTIKNAFLRIFALRLLIFIDLIKKQNVQNCFYTSKPYTVTQNSNKIYYIFVTVVSLPCNISHYSFKQKSSKDESKCTTQIRFKKNHV